MESKKKAIILINTAFYLFFAGVIYLLIKYFAVYLLPFIVSFAIIYALQKPSIFLENKLRIKKSVITLIALVLIVVVLCSVICFAIKNLISFFYDAQKNNWLYKFSDILNSLYAVVPSEIKKILGGSNSVFTDLIKKISSYVMGLMATTLKKLPGIIFSIITSLVSACFLSFEYDNFILFIKRQLSDDTIKKTIKIKKAVNESLVGFFKGYFIIMIFTLLFMITGLKILGVKNAVAISIIIALIDILPVFGTGIILLPWGVFSLISHNIFVGVGLILIYVIYSITRYFLEPRIIGRKVGVNPLISLFSMFLGLKLFGLIGLILAPVTVSVLLVLHKNKAISLWK